MSGYTVSDVAKLSGVSVRTLHHYDEVGLLKPGGVGANGYRYYGKDELLRLQQILFHRELGFALEEIRQALDAPDFDRAAALRAHRERLAADARRYRRLVRTIDETLAALQGATKMDEKAMYRGFDPEKQAEWEAWAFDRYGPRMRESFDAVKAAQKGWTQADFDRSQAEFDAIEADYAKALTDGLPADGDVVQGIARRHHAWIGASWAHPVTAAAFRGLGQLYGDHADFRARYEARVAGLVEYMQTAMGVFAERELA